MSAEQNKPLTIEEALKTAIKFETNVRNVYHEAMKEAKDSTGRRVFQILAKEEQGHLDYLDHRMEELKSTGNIKAADIESLIPPKEKIENQVAGLKKSLEKKVTDTELKLLKKAVEVEQQTSAFYRRMVDEMEGEAKKMFSKFMEIEEGHVAIVQAELDAAEGMGFFFDMEEFNLEAG